MDCPKCREKLTSEQYRENEYKLCFYCQGAWLDKQEIQKHGVIGGLKPTSKGSTYSCPSCGPFNRLQTVMYEGCELEHCSECEGVFFDKGELERFAKDYKKVDAETMVRDVTDAMITLARIARAVSELFRLLSK